MDNRNMNNGRRPGSNMPQQHQHQHHQKPPMPPFMPIETLISIDNRTVAMAYVPWQHWQEVYCPERALECGTMFPELYKPFLGRRER